MEVWAGRESAAQRLAGLLAVVFDKVASIDDAEMFKFNLQVKFESDITDRVVLRPGEGSGGA